MKSGTEPWRFRILYWFYYRGAATQYWLNRRIRPAGIAALIITSIGSFMSVGQPKNSVFQFFCFSLGLVIITLLWTLFRSGKVSAKIDIPKYGTVDEMLHYSVTVSHPNGRKLSGFALLQTPPDPRPTLSEFSQIIEPGEAQRNPFDRMMAYYRWQWLLSRNRGFTNTESDFPINLPADKEKPVSMSLTPLKRGVFMLENLRLLLPDPLGFFQKCKPVSSPSARLIVLPKRYRLPHIEMPGSAAFRIGGEETSNAIGNSGEFVSLREYRFGDSIKQIHWKSWAHTGKPMVKELEDTFYPRYALVLDTFPGSPDPMVFEKMISTASSFVIGLDRDQTLLDLMFIAGEAHMVTAGRDFERTEKLLEVLAGVSQKKNTDFDSLSSSVIRHRTKITSCLLILNGWDETRRAFLEKLQHASVLCVPLIIGSGSKPDNISGHWIDSDQIERDLLRLPSQLPATT
jgi:hypothetical protein